MFQRISSLILLFCLTAALLPHGNAAAANQKPEYFANSDVEAYVEEYLYGMDEEQGNRLYRESREHSGRVYPNLFCAGRDSKGRPGVSRVTNSPVDCLLGRGRVPKLAKQAFQ